MKTEELRAIEALNKIINKARYHHYKPIQIAEILHYCRTTKGHNVDLLNIEDYRNPSKIWRDNVTRRLLNTVCTSSQKFQDNIFDENAITPNHLNTLNEINSRFPGIIENYIYQRFSNKMASFSNAYIYLNETNEHDFVLTDLLRFFSSFSGLQRSIDKAFEIIVFALFEAIIGKLILTIRMNSNENNEYLFDDFSDLLSSVTKISPDKFDFVQAYLFRVGVTNAADIGVDILSNFGAIFQVKHITLTPIKLKEISGGLLSKSIIIVVKEIATNITQSDIPSNIIRIITLTELNKWYEIAFMKHPQSLGKDILKNLIEGFENEFPLVKDIATFMKEREYNISQFNSVEPGVFDLG